MAIRGHPTPCERNPTQPLVAAARGAVAGTAMALWLMLSIGRMAQVSTRPCLTSVTRSSDRPICHRPRRSPQAS